MNWVGLRLNIDYLYQAKQNRIVPMGPKLLHCSKRALICHLWWSWNEIKSHYKCLLGWLHPLYGVMMMMDDLLGCPWSLSSMNSNAGSWKESKISLKLYCCVLYLLFLLQMVLKWVHSLGVMYEIQGSCKESKIYCVELSWRKSPMEI